MGGNNVKSDQIIAELIEMGFEFPAVIEAIEVVGPSLDGAVEFILNGPFRTSRGASSSSKCSTNTGKTPGKRPLTSSHSLGRMHQSSITEHLQSIGRSKRTRTNSGYDTVPLHRSEMLPGHLGEKTSSFSGEGCNLKAASELSVQPVCHQKELEIGKDWEQRVNNLLHNHFGILSLKSFQKEAMSAWLAHQDCLVLAATGSGKLICLSVCFICTY